MSVYVCVCVCTYHECLGKICFILIIWVGAMHEQVDIDGQEDHTHDHYNQEEEPGDAHGF